MAEVVRSLTEERKFRLERKLHAELGAPILAALGDCSTLEIMVNPPEEGQEESLMWVETLGQGMCPTELRLSPLEVENIICTVATLLGTECHRDDPILEGELPFYKARFEGLVPPVVESPAFTIRCQGSLIFTLSELICDGVLSADQADLIREALVSKKNILVSGGTGSGKTTLINSILDELIGLCGDEQRILILEDTREIQIKARNVVQMRTSETVDLTRLVRACMRCRPDRIIVGEVRGPEALSLVKAWGTGHPGGVASIHANSARAALTRLDNLIQENGIPSQKELISETIDMVIHIERDASAKKGRRVSEVWLTQSEGGQVNVSIQR